MKGQMLDALTALSTRKISLRNYIFATMPCTDCKGIAANADGEHGLLTRKFHCKLKDALEALKKSNESCESCAFIVRH
jgi:hypothetical protein